MTPLPERITPQLVRKMELVADGAFNVLLRDIEQVKNGIYDYPTAAVVLDETGIMRLGEGVATDIRTDDPEAHAEINALKNARLNSNGFNPGIIVSTFESCQACHPSITRELGHDGLIGYVTSRSVAEELGHVHRRATTDDDSIEGVRSLQLKNPRLQAKGNFVLKELVVSRDPETGLTIIDESVLPSVAAEFAQIDARYPFSPIVYL